MPKFAPDGFYDAAFDFVDQADVMHLCSTLDSSPTYAEVVAASLADVAVVPNTDFTKAAGDTSGRKVTVAAKSGITVDVSGSYDHVALVTVSGTVLRYVTTGTPQALTAGNTANTPAFDIEIQAPA